MDYLIYISVIGSIYILYLAIKILKSTVKIDDKKDMKLLSFKDGLIMHIMNPKATLACLPIATIHYPANNITGINILITSIMLALIAVGAPTLYSFFGQYFGKFIKQEKVLKVFNILMAVLLIYVAITIFYDHVYLVLRGINEY